MRFIKSPYFTGSCFGVMTLLLYLVIKINLGLWSSFFCSLILTMIIFGYLKFKNQIVTKDILKVSFTGGITFTLIVWIGIKLFPPSVVRDLGDIVMPYIWASLMGFLLMVVFISLGFTLQKFKKDKGVSL
jgi:hypothetical protein